MPDSPDKPETKARAQKSADKALTKKSPKPRKKRSPKPSGPTPQWYKYLMFGCMAVGLLWIIVFYVTQGQFPLPILGNWNILVGFGVAILGFLMTLRWRG
ncbi:cell division protein CrgA [Sinomonas sp. ASV322]|uniref:cell division protein CrgA n=1 Tax=Sinomonas sp. ASV322 TaxID=3041920 RepID=UPI0027DD317A|nr:cell division protein CrgA [Sinomonas sp. ASV322]MDQ4501531.1 cell division protein CrgA [Sinomonas sp. ASV322]